MSFVHSLKSATAAIAVVAALGSSAALAQNDLRITLLGNPLDPTYDANRNFKAFAKEFAAIFTGLDLMPPETLGHAAWAMNVELGVANLSAISAVDQGSGNPQTPATDGSNFLMPTVSPRFEDRTPLLVPSVHFRKGLPFSFELGSRIAWMDKSAIFAGTFEVKWAVNEGFLYFPDVGLRVYGTKIFNTRDFDVGAGGFDVGVGKQIPIGGMVTITPYGGWNLVFVGAATHKPLDFDPGRSQTASQSDPNAQFQNVSVYDEVVAATNSHNRFYAGLRFRGGIIQITAEASYSALGQVPSTLVGGGTAQTPIPPVVSTGVTVGIDY